MCDLPHVIRETKPNDSFLDEFLFLINTTYPWYGYLIIYLQNQIFHPNLSHDDHRHIHHHAKYYIILNDTLHLCGIDSILWWFLTHDDAEQVLNDYQSGACGSHLSGMATTYKILHAGYFWPSIFKYFHEAVKKCPPHHCYWPFFQMGYWLHAL